MRVTFLFLLLINLLVYLWGAGHLGWRESGREPERLTSQLQPEAIHVLAPTPASHCQQLGDLDDVQWAQLRKQFAGDKDVQMEASETLLPGKYWVAIASLESRELATRKLAELTKLGVTDARLVEDARHGPFAVVLGETTDSAAAQAQLDALAPKGVRSPRIVTREAASARYRIELKWPAPQNAGKEASLQAWFNTLAAGTAPKSAPCTPP